ncbi:hypothetical protein Tco_0304302 [Tanacetum coccineum]
MVNALCNEGKLQAFVDMIDRIYGKRCLPRLIVNTCFVFVMVEEGRVKDRLVLLKRMMVKNMISDSVSFSLFGSGHRIEKPILAIEKLILGIKKLILGIEDWMIDGTDIQEKDKKKAKDKQIQARSGNGKVKSHQNEENTT